MKHVTPKFLPSILMPFFLLAGMGPGVRAEEVGGEGILEEVRARLPLQPLRLEGFIRTREGRRNIDRPLVSELRFGDVAPHMRVGVSDRFGDVLETSRITWLAGAARVERWDAEGGPLPDAQPADEIAGTGLTWSDLSLDFLWWEGAEITGRERVKTRSSHVVRVPAPEDRPDLSAVRLWVDVSALFVVRAEILGPDGAPLRRIDVDSIVEIREGVWMVKDLIIRDHANNRRLGVRFDEVVELEE